jgi:hypothetical protein
MGSPPLSGMGSLPGALLATGVPRMRVVTSKIRERMKGKDGLGFIRYSSWAVID